jgi:uncharacterized protein
MLPDTHAIEQTKKWIKGVVIGCNFCPFAAKEFKQNTIRYQVEQSLEMDVCLETFLNECTILDHEKNIETTLIIFQNGFKRFDLFLALVAQAEELLAIKKYEGIYQVASFHPLYCFAGAPLNDAANYTNRSIYPMLHLLREERVEQALLHYLSPEKIPENNIIFAREKGLLQMQALRNICMENPSS